MFVEPFPPTGAKQQVSKDRDDGHHAVWTRDGRELLFTPGPVGLSVVGVATQPTFKPVSAEAVLGRPFRNEGPALVRPYDMAPDGRIFGLVAPGAGAAADRFRVVLNWVDELKRACRWTDRVTNVRREVQASIENPGRCR